MSELNSPIFVPVILKRITEKRHSRGRCVRRTVRPFYGRYILTKISSDEHFFDLLFHNLRLLQTVH